MAEPRFLTRPESFAITWLGDRWFRGDATQVFQASTGLILKFLGGVVCDLSSVPGPLRSLAPDWRTTARPGYGHDCMYRRDFKPTLSRLQADSIYYEMLRAEGVSRVRARLMFWAVRVGGGSSYHAKDLLWGGP